MAADATTPLEGLSELGQSVWVDFLSRESIRGGHLQELIDDYSVVGAHLEPVDLREGDGLRRRLRRADPPAGRARAATSS